MANVLVKVTVQNQNGPVALNGVTVRVYQSDGVTFVTEGVTGSSFPNGEVDFTLFGNSTAVDYAIRLSLDGWRFPAGALQHILVTDPPAPNNNFGPYNALQGPTAQVAKFVVSDDQVSPQPIAGVQLSVYDSSGVTFLAQALTDNAGSADVALPGSVSPGTPYEIRLRKDGVILTSPQTFSVLSPVTPPQTNVFDFTGHVLLPPESADPDMCTLYGYFTDVSLRPAKKLRFVFKPSPQFINTGVLTPQGSSRLEGVFHSDPTVVRDKILTRSVMVDTDSSGFLSVELPRLGHFEVHVQGLEDPIEITERIYIPDAPSARLIDQLYPSVRSIAYGTDPVAVQVGHDLLIGFTLTMSSGEVITDMPILQDIVDFTAADETIASVRLFSGTQLVVQGVTAGSTTIVATRKDDQVVPSRPPVAALVVTPAVVNIGP